MIWSVHDLPGLKPASYPGGWDLPSLSTFPRWLCSVLSLAQTRVWFLYNFNIGQGLLSSGSWSGVLPPILKKSLLLPRFSQTVHRASQQASLDLPWVLPLESHRCLLPCLNLQLFDGLPDFFPGGLTTINWQVFLCGGYVWCICWSWTVKKLLKVFCPST